MARTIEKGYDDSMYDESKYDIVIIGGGPAGLFAAATYARLHRGAERKVLLLERNRQAGRKLLVTGSGQCNITHAASPGMMLSHYPDPAQTRFLRHALHTFTPDMLIAHLAALGVPCTATPEGKVFPTSLRAVEIRDALVSDCIRQGVILQTDSRVIGIGRKGSDFVLSVESFPDSPDKPDMAAKQVIITTGGASWPVTGSTGDGYRLAEALGHTIVTPVPALCGITIEDHLFSPLAGLSFRDASIRLWRNGKKILERRGALLITHEGFSGPVVLNASRFMRPGDAISCDLTPSGDQSQPGDQSSSGEPAHTDGREYSYHPHDIQGLARAIMELGSAQGRLTLAGVLRRLGFPRRFTQQVAAICLADPESRFADLRKGPILQAARLCTDHPFTISSAGEFTDAMATAGGVVLHQIDPKRMESRIVPGLFFAGEVLDIDGETGGYNLQAAFSTAYLAAQSGE